MVKVIIHSSGTLTKVPGSIVFDSAGYIVADGARYPSHSYTVQDLDTAGAVEGRSRWTGSAWEQMSPTADETAAANKAAITRIAALEAQQTPRRIREAALGTDGGWLAALDADIAAIRAEVQA